MKNLTLAIGLGWLLYGALFFNLTDWDVGVSLVMAFCTYFTAEYVVSVIRRRIYKEWLKAAFLTWFSVQGSYAGYWLLVGQPERMVEGQCVTSLCLFLLCGIIWSFLPTFQEVPALWRGLRAAIYRRP